MPKPLRYERKDDYINRFMRDEAMRREYPNPSQRYAVDRKSTRLNSSHT